MSRADELRGLVKEMRGGGWNLRTPQELADLLATMIETWLGYGKSAAYSDDADEAFYTCAQELGEALLTRTEAAQVDYHCAGCGHRWVGDGSDQTCPACNPSEAAQVADGAVAYHPAFDMPTTVEQALAWLTTQGDPTVATFDHRKAARAANLLGDALTTPTADPVMGTVTAEIERAVRKFPTWPTDPLHAVAVLGEEFGELTKAVLQSVYEPHKVQPGDVRSEAVQTAAMAMRFLQSLDVYAYERCEQHEQGRPLPSPPAQSQEPN